MQDEEKILADTVAKILKEIRLEKGQSLNLFCNEYSIPTTTLNDIENGKVNVKLFSLLKILGAYKIDFVEFFEKLKTNLPADFLEPEE